MGPRAGRAEVGVEWTVLLDDEKGRLAVIPTTRGDLCFVASEPARQVAAGCYATLRDSGVAETMTTSSLDRADHAFGLLDASVKALTVQISSGETHPVEVKNGAFWWSANVAARIVSVIPERNGIKHVQAFPNRPDMG